MKTGVEGNIWFYIPNIGAAIFFATVFGLIGCGLIYRASHGGIRRFFAVVIFGVAMEVSGFACRAVAREQLAVVAPFAAQQSLIVLAPLFIAAGNYLMTSRLILTVNGAAGPKQRLLGVPARWITPIFVSCDIVTILIQCSGTTISAGADWAGPTAKIGSHLLLAGLALQTTTIAFFLAITIRFGGHRLLSSKPKPEKEDFRGVQATFISSVSIEIRCIYRLIEHATGYRGYLWTHDWCFCLFEALPMVFAIGIFVLWYPPHFIVTKHNDESGVSKGYKLTTRGYQSSLEDGLRG